MNSFVSYFDSGRRAASTTFVITATVGALMLAVGVSRASAASGPYGLTFDPSHAVLVSMSGSDSFGQGTENNPYRTIGKGVQVAAALHENVYVAGSSSTYNEAVTLQSGVNVYGGFDPSTWTQSPSQTTTVEAPQGAEQTMLANGARSVVLYRLTLRGPLGAYGSRASTNSYGLRAINNSQVALLAVSASGGTAATGLYGVTPTGPLTPGGAGKQGNPPDTSNCLWSTAGGIGGTGAGGNNGGQGGAGGGDRGQTPLGGATGYQGLPAGAGGVGGDPGTAEGSGTTNADHDGKDGGAGATGASGRPGNGGADQSGLHSSDNTDWYGADGQAGSPGENGHGGGGGGGGGARHREPSCFPFVGCTYYDTAGGSGGGGGGGGQGGGGGTGGQAGGASFGVFVEASTVTAVDSSLAGGPGGMGGNGASGQGGAVGGQGGAAPAVISCGNLTTTVGGKGGPGGTGGIGGMGGGGAGGPSAALYEGPYATFALRGTATASGRPGQAGFGGGTPGIIGQASETIPAGATSDGALDSDHDGIPDVIDQCPTVPGGPTDLSHNGCPGSPSPLPQNTGRPTIQGSAVEGQTLTEVGASWSNGPQSSFAYQWARCDGSGSHCSAIPGATAVSYTAGPADVGGTLEVSESSRNNVGWSSPAWSDPTAPVKSAAPVNVAPPTVVGPAVAGQTLAVQRGVWANAPTTFQYQWFRCTAIGASCQSVGGQTGLSYALTGQDVGSLIKVEEIGVNGWGASAPALSALAGPVVDAPLAVQAYALVGLARSIVPGPVASFSQSGEAGAGPGSYTATISWGDGSHSRGSVIVKHSGGYLVNGEHAYAKRGNYTLAVRVTAGSGASSVGTNRVSVFTAAVCPKQSAARHQNCLGDISLPAGCVAAGQSLRLAIPSAANIAGVGYAIDHDSRFVEGQGRSFAAALSTVGLRSGTHRLTARITYRTGRPRRLNKTRTFAVC